MNLNKSNISILIISGVIISFIAYKLYSIKKQNDLKNRLDSKGNIDITGMDKYVIKIPFKYQSQLSNYYNEIGNVGYSFISDSVTKDDDGVDKINIIISARLNQISEINKILMKLNKDIRIFKIEN